MKWLISLTLFLSLLAFTTANFHNLLHKTGDDILHKLKAGNHDIYLIAFYHPNSGHQHLRSQNHHMIEDLENNFLQKNDVKDMYYAAIDSTNPSYSQVLYELNIDVNDLEFEPTLFVMEHGNGFITTGPRAIEEMKMNLNELLDNRDKGY
eukprot:CAMPEP_0205822524 /NCGR_PEP_ID=MMETSP0206-20130828/12848_1 /ASSEMBLY_ACC=CAM_ASM_000279 /TAXON_ID=36767 /ORGANISM="Euplotes focardii, Strain TN1" /LENGTH=149 /DNA_ID=CAMNT_0053118859 /DNA_START=20 /DNA_END=469 /DNA_ORIENTATION=+